MINLITLILALLTASFPRSYAYTVPATIHTIDADTAVYSTPYGRYIMPAQDFAAGDQPTVLMSDAGTPADYTDDYYIEVLHW